MNSISLKKEVATLHNFLILILWSMRNLPLICVCGKSGVGKTTIVRASGLREVISYTTRPMREGEKDGHDYHFTSREWMLANRDKFQLDWKTFGDHIYGATDDDVNNCEIIVITLDSAVKLRKLGVLMYIIWVDGPIRQDRDRKVNVDNGPDLMKEVDRILVNDGTIEDAAMELVRIWSSLKTILECVNSL